MAGRPNNTTYAILGLLAMKDWSAYALTKEMQRNLRYFWPRAESAVYVELRKLEKAGSAKARVEHRGQRATTIYSITAKGRKRLQKWLEEEPRRGSLLEAEGVLRIFSAGSLPPDSAIVERAIAAIRADADEVIEKSFGVGGEYMSGSAEFQHHIRWRAMTHTFAVNYALMLAAWCQWAEEFVAGWDGADEETVNRIAFEAFVHSRARLNEFCGTDDPPPQDPPPSAAR
jgi:PadR family transcriptional regulator AphA